MAKRLTCVDCKQLGNKSKGFEVRIAHAGCSKGIALCEPCRESRLDADWANWKANPDPCRNCGKPSTSRTFQLCDSCMDSAKDKAWAKREMMIKAGGMDVSPMADY